jgi:hypothetical protein
MEVSRDQGSEVKRAVRDYVGIYSSKAINKDSDTGVGNRLNSWSFAWHFMRERWIQPCIQTICCKVSASSLVLLWRDCTADFLWSFVLLCPRILSAITRCLFHQPKWNNVSFRAQTLLRLIASRWLSLLFPSFMTHDWKYKKVRCIF